MVSPVCREVQRRRKHPSLHKVSKPLMEKKRRARINFSLEQLKILLEKHFSHEIQKRKLEKADILELSVKYMESLQRSAQGIPGLKTTKHQMGFWSCLQGVRKHLPCHEAVGEGSGLQHKVTHVLPGSIGSAFSTTDKDPPPVTTKAWLDGLQVPPVLGPWRTQRLPKCSAPAQAGGSALPSMGGWCQGGADQAAFLQQSPQLWRPW